MTNNVLLNNVDHKDLRVITTRSARYGDDAMYAITFPSEFRNIQAHYPIVLHKTADGQFQPIALFGFQTAQNLFLGDSGWDATYLPLTIERQPFLIGLAGREMMIHVDLDSPRISATEGEPVFLPQGGNSRYLERITAILHGIHQGLAVSKAMFAAFTAHGLIEPVNVGIKFNAEEQFNLRGLYTIGEEKLRGLSGDALFELNSAGFLQGAFLVIASLNNMKKLIDMKHRRGQRLAESQAAAGVRGVVDVAQ